MGERPVSFSNFSQIFKLLISCPFNDQKTLFVLHMFVVGLVCPNDLVRNECWLIWSNADVASRKLLGTT